MYIILCWPYCPSDDEYMYIFGSGVAVDALIARVGLTVFLLFKD